MRRNCLVEKEEEKQGEKKIISSIPGKQGLQLARALSLWL